MDPYAPTGLPQPIQPTGIGPSRAPYLIGIIVIFAGVAAFVTFLLTSIFGMVDGLHQMRAPGAADFDFAEAGTYTVFHEYRTVYQGQVYSTTGGSGLVCRVTRADGGDELEVGPTKARLTYNLGSRSGIGLFSFNVATPGKYRVEVSYQNGKTSPQIILAVGHGFVNKLLTTILIGLAISFGSVGGGTLIILKTAARIKRQTLANGYGFDEYGRTR